MPFFLKAKTFLRNLLLSRQVESDLNEEVHSHLAMLTEDNLRAGMSAEEAQRAARMELGGVEQVKEQVREQRLGNWLQSVLSDCRFAFRQLRQSPGFTVVTVLTLALGIGANTAIFSVINAVMLRSLPVQHPEQLVAVGEPGHVNSWSSGNPRTDVFSYPLYREVRDHNGVFSSVLGSARLQNPRINIEGGAESINGRLVTENYFQTLGVEAALGHTFTAGDGRISGGDPVLVISYAYWQRRFGGDPSAIGRKVRLNNYPFTIIGVAPLGFFGEVVGNSTDVWAPIMMQPQLMGGLEFLERPNVAYLLMIGRLKPGVTIEQARADVNAVVEHALRFALDVNLSLDDRDAVRKMKIAVPASSGSRGLPRLRQQFESPLLLLLAMVALVLLVASANVANLMLARSTTRQREIAVRFAMGARPGRIIRQLLTESLLLAALGGALGLVFAQWEASALASLASAGPGGARPMPIGLDWRVLGFTAAVCLSAGLLFGLAPALRVLRAKLSGSLKEGGRDFETWPKTSARYVLTASQIALGMLVLMAASLLVRSLRNLEEADLGYSRDQLLLVQVDLLASGYREPAIPSATRDLLRQLAGLPGVRSVSASCNGLFSGMESTDAIFIDNIQASNDEDNSIADDQVGPDYFSTIGVPIILGREITQQDYSTAAHVAVVNETFAAFYFKGRNPLGHKIYMQDSDHPEQLPYEIVGVARDVRDHSVRGAVPRRMYAPLTSAVFGETDSVNFEIRAAGNPEMLIHSVRSALNPDLVISHIETAGGLVNDTLTSQAVVAKLSTCFGVLVLILVCVGLYGSMAYNVVSRTKEIGLRMALGAPRGGLIRMVVHEAWIALAIGLAIGIPAGIAAAHLFKAMLFGVSKADPFSIGSAVLALLVICSFAAIIPVRRATRVDPMIALRHE